PLPTYPFERERHWLSRGRGWRRRLSSADVLLAEHHVRGDRVLPGAASLECVLAALAEAAGAPIGAVHDHVWGRRIVFTEGALDVDVAVTRRGDWLHYELASVDAAGGRLVHATGRA